MTSQSSERCSVVLSIRDVKGYIIHDGPALALCADYVDALELVNRLSTYVDDELSAMEEAKDA